jgi:hypothetical protein
MTSPTRLRHSDDPLSAALEAEAQDAQHLALAPLRRRVLASVDAGASPWTEASTVGLASHAVVLVVGLALGAVAHAGWVATSTAPAASVVPTEAPLAATTAAAVPASPPPPPTTTPPRAALRSPPPSPPPRSPSPARSPSSSLADELQLFERAQGALEEGRAALAVVEFRRYRSLYPQGRLRADADAGLIRALTIAGRLEEAQDEADAARAARTE